MAISRLTLLAAGCATLAGIASAGTLFLPAYPAAVLVFDEDKAQIVDRIPLQTGTPMSIQLSADHKKIYVTTIDKNGIEVIDVATRKVTNHFVLNTPTKQYRLICRYADPTGKLFYAVTEEITKLPTAMKWPNRNTLSSIWNSRRSSRRWKFRKRKRHQRG